MGHGVYGADMQAIATAMWLVVAVLLLLQVIEMWCVMMQQQQVIEM
jgi:hypothetical protein